LEGLGADLEPQYQSQTQCQIQAQVCGSQGQDQQESRQAQEERQSGRQARGAIFGAAVKQSAAGFAAVLSLILLAGTPAASAQNLCPQLEEGT
jgi:hypothetical protein